MENKMGEIKEIYTPEIYDDIVRADINDIEIKKEAIHLDIKDKIQELLKAERLAVLGEFSARINHDLRNPLSIIKNSTSLIKEKDLTLEQKVKQCDTIERAIFRITHQIEDVLDFVELQNMEIKPCLVSQIIANAWSEIRLPKNKTELQMTYENDVTIDCDQEQIKIAFKNILLNAVQSMDYQGKINITISEVANRVQVEIEDNGPGISEEILPKIFDPLFTTKQIGTGLGLSSCNNIIKSHRGKISVNTKMDAGTRFTIDLPINPYQVFNKYTQK
ncbi:MAG: GHKL domain-containing protein [Nitrosopumilales archaeon]|nr:MAG: GHKL domain-containing protein [Nitrosopumilales archaeon]